MYTTMAQNAESGQDTSQTSDHNKDSWPYEN